MSSLAIAVPLGVASATVYGTSIVVQHRVVHESRADGPRGLTRVIRDPRWLLAMCGDAFGFLLQIAALSAGPVVLIQPLVVLMLPVALMAGFLMGGPRPNRGDYLGCVAIVGGLGGFLALVGTPGNGHVPHPHRVAIAVALVLILVLGATLAVRGLRPVLRGAVYGGGAGACFGTLAVMVDAASDRVSRSGVHGLFDSPRGFVPLIAMGLVGVGGMVLTMVSFQVGSLSATLPVNLATDPTTAVVFGAILLHERIPTGPLELIGYVVCLLAVIIGAVRLAAPATGERTDKPTAQAASG
ncbi:MAG: DMT family transporter [Jatrophihabitantaceae bacterium]